MPLHYGHAPTGSFGGCAACDVVDRRGKYICSTPLPRYIQSIKLSRMAIPPKASAPSTDRPSPQLRARACSDDLAGLAALLSAEHKRQILDRLEKAFSSAGERIGPRAETGKARTSSPKPVTVTPHVPGTRCPHCGVSVNPAKLTRHIRKIHPSVLGTAAAAPRTGKQKVVECDACKRVMTRDVYQAHVCRLRTVVVSGGAPGSGRRR
jgi:hypothetical protein